MKNCIGIGLVAAGLFGGVAFAANEQAAQMVVSFLVAIFGFSITE